MSLGHDKGGYRPWHPPAFDAPASAPAPVPEAAGTQTHSATSALPPTGVDLDEIREEARRAGFAAGFAEARAQGREETRRLAALVSGLEQALSRVDADVAEELVGLSVELARLMLRRDLAHRPEGVVDIVREALTQLPQHHAQIHLHPRDAALVRSHLGEHLGHAGHRLVEDDRVSPGGCRIETTGSQVDATLQTRWRRILQNLGRADTNWDVGQLP